MLNKLWIRLSLAFLIVAWLATAAIALLVRTTTETSFRRYVQDRNADTLQGLSSADLEAYYAETGSWQGVESLLPGPRGGRQGQGQSGRERAGGGGPMVIIADQAGIVVAATDSTLVGLPLDQAAYPEAESLRVDGDQVGLLVQTSPTVQVLGETEHRFLDQINRHLLWAAAGATLLALITGALLAWQITRPLRTLTHAVIGLKAGHLGQQVAVSGSEEIRALAAAFNSMSHDLNAGERLRRRMAADVAHELRTPVSVLRGHLEAMLDGVFPLDTQRLATAYDQTLHLTRLVEDLRLLTRAEAGQLPLEKKRLSPADLVRHAAALFAPLAADVPVGLIEQIAPDLSYIEGDADRLRQVMNNLLANALRHTPPNGTITISAAPRPDQIEFRVTNTGSRLSSEQQAQVFKPFWRADDARERDEGGSGLGLAIVQQLITLHGGAIWVESGPDQTAFVFTLPAPG
jgi:signal transduction histidine kinase